MVRHRFVNSEAPLKKKKNIDEKNLKINQLSAPLFMVECKQDDWLLITRLCLR